jgi:hypothetical protein
MLERFAVTRTDPSTGDVSFSLGTSADGTPIWQDSSAPTLRPLLYTEAAARFLASRARLSCSHYEFEVTAVIIDIPRYHVSAGLAAAR